MKEKNENVPEIGITEVLLSCYGLANNQCQHDSRVLGTFFPNRSFCQLLNISTINHTYSDTFHSESSEMRFTDYNSKPLEIEDSINLNFGLHILIDVYI